MKSYEVEIDEETLKAFEALPNGGGPDNKRKWTEKEDALLLRFWPTKNHDRVAQLLGVCKNTALRRYRELTDETN